MAINHEVKNVPADSAGYLIDKFSKTGRVRVKSYQTVDKKIYFVFYIETKDLFAHLLKPSAPYELVLVDTQYESDGNDISVFPCVFPDGIINTISLLSPDLFKIGSFEIGLYGNEKNEFNGSTRWFYVNSGSMTNDEKMTFSIDPNDLKQISPFSYNFVAIKIKTINGGYILGKAVEDTQIQDRLREFDTQFTFQGDLSTLEEIPSTITKSNLSVIPYVQFNIVKGV